jgi:hypothetical protein
MSKQTYPYYKLVKIYSGQLLKEETKLINAINYEDLGE